MDLGASRLAQHSMRLVDGESCCSSCADKMAALDVAKGGSTDDDDGRVATWWRPAEPCTCRSFAAACSAGGSGGLTRLEAACGTLELRDERRSNVGMGSSPSACVHMEAETRSVLRVPACALGPAPAVWATQVAYVVHPGCLTAVSSAFECHPAIRTGWGGVPHREGDRYA